MPKPQAKKKASRKKQVADLFADDMTDDEDLKLNALVKNERGEEAAEGECHKSL